MSEYVAICTASSLIPGIGVAALVDDQQIAIFRLRDGSLHAIGNFDPFSAANVLSRGLTGSIAGEPVVASPIYKQHFSLNSGQCLEDASVVLPVYAVCEQEGVVYVRALPLLDAIAIAVPGAAPGAAGSQAA